MMTYGIKKAPAKWNSMRYVLNKNNGENNGKDIGKRYSWVPNKRPPVY